ncbi:MAG: Hsp20/alpha crystallin family protein [Moheibacter sp.]
MNTIMKRNQDLFGGLLDSLFNDSPLFSSEVSRHYSVPAVNIKNNENSFEVEVAAPGLKKEDFNIEVEDNVMKLSVNKSLENEEKDENFTRKEFSYFNFQRSFTLPRNVVDTEKVEANYKDGILSIVLPKQEQKEAVKKITVQ